MPLSHFQVMPARLFHLPHDSGEIHGEPEQQAPPDQMKCHNRANELPSVNYATVQLPAMRAWQVGNLWQSKQPAQHAY